MDEKEEASLGLSHSDKIHYEPKPGTVKAQERYAKQVKEADEKSK